MKRPRTRRQAIVLALVVLGVVVIGSLPWAEDVPYPNFQSGETISSAEVNENFAFLVERVVPVGSIIAWHKHFGPGAPALGANWAECNGQVISDASSPFDGQTLPNLNGGGRFLRGAATSGTLQDDQNKLHNHSLTFNNTANGDPLSACVGCPDNLIPWSSGGGDDLTVSVSSSGNTEARPVNMSVVWIMRIK